jgi:DNA-directed RNA polymerase subunit RPC12/RpoP
MFTLTCPKCQKNSYSSAEEFFLACPYCGFKFSGKYGPDRRREERVRRENPFDLVYQEQTFKASTIDLSEKGLSIMILNNPPVSVGDIIGLVIGDLHVSAKVMWVNKLPDKSFSGLQRLN